MSVQEQTHLILLLKELYDNMENFENMTNGEITQMMASLEQDFEKKKETLPPNITMKVYGFVENIQELYCASDVFFTKAGPNAIQDCIFMKTPVMVNFYASPVEEFTNKLYIKQYKCGETILDKVKARKKVEKWIDHPALLDEYRKNCDKLDKTQNGADEIADTIYASLKYYKPKLFTNDGDNK